MGSKVLTTWSYVGATLSPGCAGTPTYAYGSGVATWDRGSPPQDWSLGGLTSGCGSPPTPLPLVPYLQLSAGGGAVIVPQGSGAQAGLAAYPAGDCGRLSPTGPCNATWSRTIGQNIVTPAVALADGRVALAVADGRVVVLDGTTGETAWTGDAGGPLAVPVAASTTTVYAARTDGTVAAFPIGGCGEATCTPAWTAASGGAPGDRPSIGGGVLYVGSATGTVTALPADGCGAETCTPLWTASVGSAVAASPVIHEGTLYVGNTEGTVTAFHLPPDT